MYANVGVTGHQISQLPQIRMQMQRSQVNVKVADDRQTHHTQTEQKQYAALALATAA